MTFAEGLSMVLVIGGVLVILASFTNVELISGMWVAGDIKRDAQFVEAGQFKKRVYWILRIVGFVAFGIGLAMMYLD